MTLSKSFVGNFQLQNEPFVQFPRVFHLANKGRFQIGKLQHTYSEILGFKSVITEQETITNLRCHSCQPVMFKVPGAEFRLRPSRKKRISSSLFL